jgi:hypothetical protein
MAMILITICWLIAVFLTWLAFFKRFYGNSLFCIPIQLNMYYNEVLVFTVTIGSLGLLLYLMTVIFYIRIYVTVKRAAQNAGVKRESKLAKRIALLVGSNVSFFVVPLLLSSIITLSVDSNLFDGVFREMIITVFPAFCLSLNSFLNPVLHAFRTDLFKQVTKERFSMIRHQLRSLMFALYESVRCRATNQVHPDSS